MENNSNLKIQNNSNSKGFLALGAIVLVAGVIGYKNLTKPNPNLASPNETTINLKPAETKFKDGIYDVVGEYTSPGGPETIDVKLTLKNNIVTDATVLSQATLEKSQRFQGLFIDNYKSLVIGKPIKDIKLDKVAGSSLTPIGFNAAIEKIKNQART